jgi:hypothetical protein
VATILTLRSKKPDFQSAAWVNFKKRVEQQSIDLYCNAYIDANLKGNWVKIDI